MNIIPCKCRGSLVLDQTGTLLGLIDEGYELYAMQQGKLTSIGKCIHPRSEPMEAWNNRAASIIQQKFAE